MNYHPKDPQKDHARRQKWIRRGVLILLMLIGISVSTLERRQPDLADRIWRRPYDLLTRGLNPIRERTYRLAKVAFRLDRLWDAEQANQGLQRSLSELRMQNQLLTEQVGQMNRLSGLGRWAGPPELTFLPSVVIGLVTSEQSAALIIDRGWIDGVRPRDPVVALGGLVGVVQSASAHTARVLALNDPVSSIGAMDRNTRARGIVEGRGRNESLAFMPENEVQPMNIGDELVTSGFDNSVYPKGIVIGKITNNNLNSYGIPYGVVTPTVSFSQLEEVMLVIPRSRLHSRDHASTGTLGRYTVSIPSVGPAKAADHGTTSTTETQLAGQPVPSDDDDADTATDTVDAADTTSDTTETTDTMDTTETTALPPDFAQPLTTDTTTTHNDGTLHLPRMPNANAPVKIDMAHEIGLDVDEDTTKVITLPPYRQDARTTPTGYVNPKLSPEAQNAPKTGKKTAGNTGRHQSASAPADAASGSDKPAKPKRRGDLRANESRTPDNSNDSGNTDFNVDSREFGQ